MNPPLSRELIVRTAHELIATDGMEKLSLRRLASELGVTAPALYAHVEDKEDLLRAVADLAFADLIERYLEVEDEDPIEHLRAIGHAYVQFALDRPELWRIMFLFRPREIDMPTDNVLDSASDAFEVPFGVVHRALEAGALHPDRDPLVTALTLWTAAHGAASMMLMTPDMDPAIRDAVVNGVIDASLVGLREPPIRHEGVAPSPRTASSSS